jgi:hypothetical protein
MNVELLRKIAAVIQIRRGQFSMKCWHKEKGQMYGVESFCEIPEPKREVCGTTHCFAGWAQVLSPERNCRADAEEDARRLLELSQEEAQRLFYADNWPRGFGGWNANAKKAAARIEHFIATDGRE